MSAGALSSETSAAPKASALRWRGAFMRWIAFWDRRERATSLAFTRILVGSVLFLDMLLARYRGAAEALLAPPPFGMGTGAAAVPSFLPAPSALAGDDVAVLWWALVLVASLMFASGALYKSAGALLTLALVNFAHFDPNGDAIDTLYRVVVPILTLSRANARFSVDAWLGSKLGRPPPTMVPAWPRYLLMLQLLWMYFSAAHCRDDAAWWPHGGFAAIGNVMGDPHFARFPPGSLVSLYPLTQLGTAVSMAFEMSAPLMVFLTWFRRDGGGSFGAFARRWRIRAVWLATGAALHLGIALTMTLGMFPYGVLALYPLFLHPDEYTP
jgi:hypothetical protein